MCKSFLFYLHTGGSDTSLIKVQEFFDETGISYYEGIGDNDSFYTG